MQGVFFRATTKDKALELGVSGWVCNKPDGDVYIEAEGDSESMENFIEWVQKGPQFSKVSEVTKEEGTPAGFEGFEIRYI